MTESMLMGIKEMKAALDSLGGKVANKIVRTALRAGGKPIRVAMVSAVPEISGTLRKTIKVRAGRRRRKRISVLVGESAKGFQGPAFYGGPVEFGHHQGKRPAGIRRKNNPAADTRPMIPGKHYMEAAYQATEAVAVETIVASLREQLPAAVQEAKGGGGNAGSSD